MISDSKPARAERAADAEHLVADRVAVAERREDLMHARRGHHFTTGPAGAASTTSRAGGSVRARRAKKPGSGSMRPSRPARASADRTSRDTSARSPATCSGAGRTRGRSARASRRAGRRLRARTAPRRTPRSSRSTGRRCCGCTWPRSTSQWPLASTGLPSAHASSATIDRLSYRDGMISTSAAASASNLSSSEQEARDAGSAGASGPAVTSMPISTRSSPCGYITA